MLNVALTGNIASGKSTVLGHFAAWGAAVIDADRLVHEAQQPGTPTLAAIARRFGTDVLEPDGSLDRERLRHRVLEDVAARRTLEEIVHPVVRRRRHELAREAAARGDCVLVNDIPLLFEALDPAAFDLVVLVDAPVGVRRERLCRTRGLSPDEADRLIAAQLPSDIKRARSAIVIDNGGTLAELDARAWDAWRTVRARAAAQLAGGGGRLLAVFAHPDDAAVIAGGTLARYADTGVETHLLCATRGGASRLADRAALDRAAAVLGLTGVTVVDRPGGALEPGDDAGLREVAAAIRRLAPAVILTFGPDGVDGDSDHVAVHHWTRRAWDREGRPERLCCVAYPDDVARHVSRRLHGLDRGAIHAQLDVRPWRDVQRAAIAAHASRREPFDAADPAVWAPLDREWYVLDPPPAQVVPDLFASGEPPVDSLPAGG